MNPYMNRETRTHFAIVILIATTVLFTNLGGTKLWDRDEPRNAGCAAEMLERGNLITPIFNDELRGAKPVLTYWFIMSAYKVFGINEFSARFWSALLGVGTVVLTWFCGRRLFNARAGMLAAIVLSTSLMFVVAGRAATPDSVLIFFVTLAMSIYILNVFPANGIQRLISSSGQSYFPQRYTSVVAFYAAMGMAVLAKGPVGLILPTAIIGMFLLIKRLPVSELPTDGNGNGWRQALSRILRTFHPVHFARTCWTMRPLTAIGVVLLIAGPWYYAVAVQTDGDFLHAFFVQEHFGRATTAMENHNGNLLFYPLTMMAGLFPWSIFTLPLILMLWKQLKRQNDSATENWTDGYTLSICWIAVWIAAFTLARTKLPSYATPCYPAAALLVGAFLQRWMQQHRDVPAKISRLSFGTLALVGLAVSIALPIAISRFLPGEQWLTIVGLVLLCGGTIAFAFALWRKQEQAVVAMSVTAVLFCLALFVVAAGTISRHREDASVLARISKQTESNPSAVGAYGCMESSWVFYSNAPVHELSQSDHRTEFRERLNNWKPKPKLDVNTFFEQHRDGLVLTRRSDLEKVQQHSLRELRIVDEVSYLMEQDKLVLLHVADHVNLAKASASKLSESGKTR